jgi:hypothetical protein
MLGPFSFAQGAYAGFGNDRTQLGSAIFERFPIVHFWWLGSVKAWTPGQPQPRVKP